MKSQNSNKGILKWSRGELDFSGGCIVMGVLNITADSFSDGGKFLKADKAIEHGLEMVRQGASIIDVGAESTRPGSEPVPVKEQIERTVSVIEALSKKLQRGAQPNFTAAISIDSYNCEVARAALEAGASIINDITALADEDMARVAIEYKVPVILMHMQGRPTTMQNNPQYDDVVGEVLQFLVGRAKKAERFGIAKEMIFIDPGIGFGKTTGHNLLLLKNIDRFVATGYRVLVGASRKRFIGEITGRKIPAERIFGTAATVAFCAAAGVSIVRVHDAAEMVDVVKVVNAIEKS